MKAFYSVHVDCPFLSAQIPTEDFDEASSEFSKVSESVKFRPTSVVDLAYIDDAGDTWILCEYHTLGVRNIKSTVD